MVRIDLHPRLDQVQRVAHSYDARQPLRSAVSERQSPALVQQSEFRALVYDAKVTPDRELDTAGVAAAVDRGDHGLAGVEASEAHGPRALGVSVLEELLHALQVRTGTERLVAGTRDDENLRGVVGAEGDDGIRQRHRQFVIDVVVNRRPVQGEQRDIPSTLDQKLRHSSPRLFGPHGQGN